MMTIVLLLATVDLGWLIVQDILSSPMFLLEVEELLDIFGFFLLVLIGIELLRRSKPTSTSTSSTPKSSLK